MNDPHRTDTLTDTVTEVYTLHRGQTPLLVSLPHCGTTLPDWLQPRLQPRALAVEDTDWHLERLYGFARALGASLLVPVHSRYVVDLNRPPENQPMYPGRNNTELCPTRFFTGEPLYRSGQAPDEAEVQQRVQQYWQPYHGALRDELDRLRAAHGHAVLFDGHSIKSALPWLFDGELPGLNLGTADGAACDATLTARIAALFAAWPRDSHVVNGRFKGGYITRHYGRPAAQVHAVQLEMSWRVYLDEAAPHQWHAERAGAVAPLLQQLLQTLIDWRPQ
jgi:N-formylglutamate deformylase